MKWGKIIILSLIILLTLGAVNASQDTNNNLTVSDDEITIEKVDDNIVGEVDSDLLESQDNGANNITYSEITADDFYIYTAKALSSAEDEWDLPQIIVSNFPKDGTLQIFVDNNLKFNKKIVAKNNESVVLDIDSVKGKLGMTSHKDYSISIKYTMDNIKIDLANYRFYLYDEDSSIYIYSTFDINNKNDVIAQLTNPYNKYVIGTVKVAINGKQVYSKKFKSSDKIRTLYIKDSKFHNYKPANYNVKITFVTNKGETVTSTRTVEFLKTIPKIYYPSSMSVGESQYITLQSQKGSTGTLTLYQCSEDRYREDWNIVVKDKKLVEVKVVNGHANIPLNQLTKGDYRFILEYNVAGHKYSDDININVLDNSKGFSAKVTPSEITVDDSIKVKLTGPKSSYNVDIYVDNELKTSLKLKTGQISKKISGLKVGKHTIRVQYDIGNKYFSKTFEVVVKKSANKLTLKKVKIKKSIKKIKLTATLKIKGKVAKNKKVTFKFNKKTFKAKTNKKGIAKVTIKKKFLKELKVGNKVQYEVNYQKTTVKRTTKVLR